MFPITHASVRSLGIRFSLSVTEQTGLPTVHPLLVYRLKQPGGIVGDGVGGSISAARRRKPVAMFVGLERGWGDRGLRRTVCSSPGSQISSTERVPGSTPHRMLEPRIRDRHRVIPANDAQGKPQLCRCLSNGRRADLLQPAAPSLDKPLSEFWMWTGGRSDGNSTKLVAELVK